MSDNQASTTKPAKKGGALKTLGIGFVLVIGLSFAIAQLGHFNAASQDYCTGDDGKINAYLASHDYVKQALKAPATAEFPKFGAQGVYVVETGECVFRVTAYVDAENAFGAKLRKTYDVEVRSTRSGSVTRTSEVRLY